MQLSDVTQQNAALVEESASAADSLNEQAQKLVEVVGVFKVGQERTVAKRMIADQGLAPSRARSAASSLPRVQPLAQPKANARSSSRPDYVSPNEQALLAGARNTARAEEWEEF
jgi:methyl-accepting chemotaxis protein